MEDWPLVSVIVPVYNMQDTVRKCLESIRSQTYENIEIIAIDDGSTDNSEEIIKGLSEKDQRIVFISRPNKGLSLTLKEGIDISSGSWILFVDSDDYIDINLIEKLVVNQKKYNADVVQGSIRYIDVNGKQISLFHSTKRIITDKNELLRAYFLFASINTTFASNLIRKELISDAKFYDGAISMDLQVMPFVYASCSVFVQLTEPYYNAVQFPDSVSRGNVSDKMFDDKFLCNEVLQGFFDSYASDLQEYMFYRKTGVAANLYLKIKYGKGELTDREGKLEKCRKEFKDNYKLYLSSKLLKTLPKKNRYKMALFHFSPFLLYVLTKLYSKMIKT